MRKILRAIPLALMLAATPACASLKLDNPVAAAKTPDQQAYALISIYADVLEAATDIVADPSPPPNVKQALARAEAAATPSVQTLEIAIIAYLRAEGDVRAATNAGTPAAVRAATTFTAVATRLSQAIAAARPPVHALQTALKN